MNEPIPTASRGGPSGQHANDELPPVSPQEAKVIDLEIRASAAAAAADKCTQIARDMATEIIWLRVHIKEQKEASTARLRFFAERERQRMLGEIAEKTERARIATALGEQYRAEAGPARQIAEAARQELQRATAAAQAEANLNAPPRELCAEELEAAEQFARGSRGRDDIPVREVDKTPIIGGFERPAPPVRTPEQLAIAAQLRQGGGLIDGKPQETASAAPPPRKHQASGDWLARLASKAYGTAPPPEVKVPTDSAAPQTNSMTPRAKAFAQSPDAASTAREETEKAQLAAQGFLAKDGSITEAGLAAYEAHRHQVRAGKPPAPIAAAKRPLAASIMRKRGR